MVKISKNNTKANASSRKHIFNSTILLFMFFISFFCFSYVAYADVTNSDLYVYANDKYEIKSDDFNIFLEKDQKELDFRYDAKLSAGSYIDEVDLSISNFDVSCNKETFYDDDVNLSVINENGKDNFVKNIRIEKNSCNLNDLSKVKKYNKETDYVSTSFSMPLPKLLYGEFNYDVSAYGKDNNSNLIKDRKDGVFKLIRNKNNDYVSNEKIDSISCKDESIEYFNYLVDFDVYFYEYYEKCYVTVNNKDYKNYKPHSIMFYENPIEESFEQNKFYYTLTFNNSVNKQLSDAGFYINIYCEKNSKNIVVYNSWVSIPQRCKYVSNVVEEKPTTNITTINNTAIDSKNATKNINITNKENITNATTIKQTANKGFFSSLFNKIKEFFSGLFGG